MYLSQLNILQVRNLQDIQISCHPEANILCGLNGSGKTSFLEAIYLLGRGRSFRHRDLRVVINNNADNLIVSGKINRSNNQRHTLGIRRTSRGQFEARRDGESLHSSAELTELLPLQLIDAQSFLLLEGGPKQRRQFLDWGVFHVEHSYKVLWRKLQKALKQRNELLRHDRIDHDLLKVWSQELMPLCEQISKARQNYLDELTGKIASVAGAFDLPEDYELEYYPGWDNNQSLDAVFESDLRRDIAVKRTHSGPHRADLRIKIGGRPATGVLSRGQTKLLVYVLKLAQAEVYRDKKKESCLFLLDDLPAELDYQHRIKVINYLDRQGGQYFMTGVDRQDFEQVLPNIEHKMFHVEHGAISPG